MKILLTLLLTASISFSSLGQNYDIYRVVAHSNEINIYSISNTIKVVKPHNLLVPNIFSPDGDGVNDIFNVVGNGLGHITLEIYGRWGRMVFSAPHLTEGWDGTFRGKKCPIGTYVYQLKIDGKVTQSGTVTLVR